MTAFYALVAVLAVLVAFAGYVTTGKVRPHRGATTAGGRSSGPPTRAHPSGTPASGTSASGGPASGTHAPGGPASGGPASGTSASGGPASGGPAPGNSASGTPASGGPAPSGPSVVVAATRSPAAPPAPEPGQLPVAAALAAAARAALAGRALGPSVHGLVLDAVTGAVLLDRSASTAAPPASTAKLATASAVLAVVSPQRRLTTRLVAGSRPGQVVLVGGGDPTLSAAPAGQPTLYPNAARLSSLAAAARAALGRPITSILVDTSLYTGAVLGPGWDANDVPTTYGAPIQALMVDGGRPATGGDLRSAHPALEAGRALARLLGRPALAVTAGRAAAGARVLGAVRSEAVLDLVEQALLYSDNVIAEMLGRLVALAEHRAPSFAGAVVAIRVALASVGFRLPRTLADASGLSRRDRLSPAVLAALLRLDASPTRPVLNQVVSALPVAGWQGTLAQRYRTSGAAAADRTSGAAAADRTSGAAAAGRVRAKTGTLTGVVALAGLVRDRSGRLLVFAFIADRVAAGAKLPAEAALDRVVASFAACGCR